MVTNEDEGLYFQGGFSIYCKNCGTKNEKGAKYCLKCGHNLHSTDFKTPKALIVIILFLIIGVGLLSAYLLSLNTTPTAVTTTYTEKVDETQAYQPSWKLINSYNGVGGDYRSFTTRGKKFKISYSAEPLVNYYINYLDFQVIHNGRTLENGYISWDSYESPKTKSGTIEVNKGPGTYNLDIYTYDLKNWEIKIYDYY